MAKGVINLQKESGGVTKITSTDGATNTELVLPESGNIVSVDSAVTDNTIARFDGTMYRYSQVYTTEVSEAKLDKMYIKVCIEIYNKYLNDTGWYVERLNDPSSGKAIPKDVLVKRAEARALINELEVQLEATNG